MTPPPIHTRCPMLQMEPVPKAVLGAALAKPRRPVIACSVCQIRFNSEVRPFPKTWGPPPPIWTHTRGPAPLWAAVAASWGCFSAESRIHGMSVSPQWGSLGCSVSLGCPQGGGPIS